MSDKLWERLGALAGIVFVALTLTGALLAGSPPDLDASGDKIVKFFTDKDKQLLVGAYLNGLAVPFLLWFAVTLRARLAAAPAGATFAGVAVAGAVATVPVALAAFAFSAVGALRADEGLDPDTMRAFYLLYSVLGTGAVAFGASTFTIGVALASLRAGVFPLWLRWISLLVGVGWLVPGLAVASDANWLIGGALLAFLAWSVWIVVISGFMLRDTTKSAA